jgi:hypothetical protein
MPDLSFAVENAEAVPFAATPNLALKLRIGNSNPNETIHTVALRAQIQFEVGRRQYTPEEQEKLVDLFGSPDRWSQTLRTMLWTQASVVVPAFKESTVIDLPVPCTFDFNVAATKYFHALQDGDIPLCLQFSGTVFYLQEGESLQVAPISWDKETKFRMPVRIWREMMDIYYPNTAALNLRRDVFERLYEYKTRNGIPTWEEALERMLPVEETLIQ